MRNVTDDIDTRVVSSAHHATPHRLRRFGEPVLLVLAVGVLLAVQVADGPNPPATPSAAPAATASRPPPARPGLLATQSASPGQQITVLAFRNRRLCDATELRFDGAPLAHRLAGYAGPLNLDRVEMFLTARVPRSAEPGRHEITLYGSVPGGGRAPTCGEVRDHQAKLATTSMLVQAGS